MYISQTANLKEKPKRGKVRTSFRGKLFGCHGVKRNSKMSVAKCYVRSPERTKILGGIFWGGWGCLFTRHKTANFALISSMGIYQLLWYQGGPAHWASKWLSWHKNI